MLKKFTMDHLLAAVEANSSATSSSSDEKSPRPVEAEQYHNHHLHHPHLHRSPLSSPEEDAMRVKFIRTDHGATRVPSPELHRIRDLKPLQPAPKLPPISSLTRGHGVPPSLQLHSVGGAPPLAPPQPPPQQSYHRRDTSGLRQLYSASTAAAAALGGSAPPSHADGAAISSSSSSTATGEPQSEHLCRYRNKLCLNTRAVKRNGEMHNLCEKHRAKANQNQRKLESKRRVQKRHSRVATTSSTTASTPPRTYPHDSQGVSGPLPTLAQLHHQQSSPRSSNQRRSPYPPLSYNGEYPPY